MLDRITSMQIFARVAGSGSFASAARAASLSQTMVTKHVTALEERLGVRLFQRSTRRLSLTEAGRIYLDGCLRVLPELEEIELAASVERLEPRGLLRLNAPVSFAIRYIAPMLAEFSRQYPQVSVELGLNDRRVDLIEEGWDLTIRIYRMGNSTLRTRRLAATSLVVCAAPAYLAAHGTPRTVSELAEHACLGYTLAEQVGSARWSFGRDGDVSIPVRGPLVANNGDVLREAAIAGMGIVYQPRFIVADELRAGQLQELELDHPPVDGAGVHAVYAPGGRVPLKVRVMIDFLAESYGTVPPWEADVT